MLEFIVFVQIKLRMERGNVPKRQQPDHGADNKCFGGHFATNNLPTHSINCQGEKISIKSIKFILYRNIERLDIFNTDQHILKLFCILTFAMFIIA